MALSRLKLQQYDLAPLRSSIERLNALHNQLLLLIGAKIAPEPSVTELEGLWKSLDILTESRLLINAALNYKRDTSVSGNERPKGGEYYRLAGPLRR